MPSAPPSNEAPRRALVALAGTGMCGCATAALLFGANLGLSWFVVDILLVGAALMAFRQRLTIALAVVVLANLFLGFSVVYYASQWAVWVAFPTNVGLLLLLPFVATTSEFGRLPRSLLSGVGRAPRAARKAAHLPVEALDSSRSQSLLSGVLVGLPLSALFALLLSADSKFRDTLSNMLERAGDVAEFCAYSFVASVVFLFLYVLHRPEESDAPSVDLRPYRTPPTEGPLEAKPAKRASGPRVRPLTWGVVLGQLVLVFGLFAVVHAQEFFGGHALARARGTVTYAEYLHAGFEELLCATILAVLTVLVGHVLLRDRGFFHRSVDAPASIPGGRSLAILEVVLLALVGVALASCWQRSSVYEVAYGYTYFRLAVRFIEVAVAVLVALTIVKAVARSWRGFRTAMAMAYFATLLAAAGFNADRYIARENVARAAAAKDGTGSPFAYKPLDLDYLEGLSQDAFPVLADTYFDSDPDAAAHLEAAWTRGSSSRGWRSFRGLAGRSRVRRTSTFPASRSRD